MLKHKIELYVPVNTVGQQKVALNAFKTFCKAFGAATINPVIGGGIDEKGVLVSNKINIVYSYVSILSKKNRQFAEEMAVSVRKELKEDAVTLVIDDVADFY